MEGEHLRKSQSESRPAIEEQLSANDIEVSQDGYANFADVCTQLFQMQASLTRSYINGLQSEHTGEWKRPSLKSGIRFQHENSKEVWQILIHKDDIHDFFDRIKDLKISG